MISYRVYICILLGSWLVPSVIGAFRLRYLDKAARTFWWLVNLALATDGIAIFMALTRHSNIEVYTVGCILYTLAICLYFNQQVALIRKWKIGFVLGVLSLATGLLDSTLIQPFPQANSYFRVYEAILIVCLGLASMGMTLNRHEYVDIRRQPHFWLSAILVFFWSFMYLHLLLYDYFTQAQRSLKWVIDLSILIANVLSNISIGLVFYFYPKMVSPHETSTR